jgi:hypothetical protein
VLGNEDGMSAFLSGFGMKLIDFDHVLNEVDHVIAALQKIVHPGNGKGCKWPNIKALHAIPTLLNYVGFTTSTDALSRLSLFLLSNRKDSKLEDSMSGGVVSYATQRIENQSDAISGCFQLHLQAFLKL